MEREYGFELGLCAALEQETEWLLARQLGGAVADPGQRIVDVVGVVPGPAFADRARITASTIPPAAVEADLGVGRARPPQAAFDCRPERRAAVVADAVDCGFLTREPDGTQPCVRQTTRYPDEWVGELVAIENKPDLDRPGGLREQLRLDASLALFDRVVLATATHVTGAHRNRIPDPVGIWRFDPESGQRRIVRSADRLPVAEPGIEPRAYRDGRTDISVVSPAAKHRRRCRIAERAYGKGWRPDAYPACARCEPTDDGRPWCAAYDRVVDPASECGTDCPHHDPADPPVVDTDRLRDARTPWERAPDGTVDRQVGLGDFG
mgnify:FL=1